MQPHRAVSRPQVAVDPGNRFTKWIECQTVRSIPSYVKELSDWEEGGADGQNYEIGFEGRRYASRTLGTVDGWLSGFRVWQS
ncbi:hypothetical protein [Microcoleus vaginatus]|uniref:hypothetical protein n=1 Tax=Microcoleus vaginatus TaxID=119532 RepID=UPI0016860995|nr:hypothetical protein [Microcoleus sp. FACHB-84]MBD2008012.1 hypothetical protein [Microcoleus sp. FACHB-45]